MSDVGTYEMCFPKLRGRREKDMDGSCYLAKHPEGINTDIYMRDEPERNQGENRVP
jgi:hypothetical protein